jgi:PhnB protein
MRLNPYLTFNGQCEEAFRFYAECFGGKIEAMFPFAGTPGEGNVPPEWQKKIMHVRMAIGDQTLMGSDCPPSQHGAYVKPQGFSVSVQIKEPAEAERVFNALSKNGSTLMPLQQTFWARRFGMCTDRFGIPWMVNCE